MMSALPALELAVRCGLFFRYCGKGMLLTLRRVVDYVNDCPRTELEQIEKRHVDRHGDASKAELWQKAARVVYHNQQTFTKKKPRVENGP